MVSEQVLGPWGYIADVCQKYFGGELNSTILGGLINQRLGLGTPNKAIIGTLPTWLGSPKRSPRRGPMQLTGALKDSKKTPREPRDTYCKDSKKGSLGVS